MASESFRRILEVLEQHGVDYVVVGGVAAVLQGAPVTTFDIDALVKISPANSQRLRKALDALDALDARYSEHGSLRPTTADLAAGGHLLPMTSADPLDVLGFIGGGKRFEDVAQSTDAMTIGDIGVRVLSLEALIEEKRALGRDKDQAALKILEALLARRRAT